MCQTNIGKENMKHIDKQYRDIMEDTIGKYEFPKKQPVVKSIDSLIVTGTTEEGEPLTITFSDFDKDKTEIERNNDNGKQTLSVTIHGDYNVKVEY